MKSGEQAHLRPDNTFEITVLGHGIDSVQAREVWQPFIDWAKHSPDGYSVKWPVIIGAIPAQHFWDVEWWKPLVALLNHLSFVFRSRFKLQRKLQENIVPLQQSIRFG